MQGPTDAATMLHHAQHDIACGSIATFQTRLGFIDRTVPESLWSDPGVCTRIADSLHAHIDRARLGLVDAWTYDCITAMLPGAPRGLQIRAPKATKGASRKAMPVSPPASPAVSAFRPHASAEASPERNPDVDSMKQRPSGEQAYVVEDAWAREAVPEGGAWAEPVILNFGGRRAGCAHRRF